MGSFMHIGDVSRELLGLTPSVELRVRNHGIPELLQQEALRRRESFRR
jgi:hypothetical protein